jgi:hypothetical protein
VSGSFRQLVSSAARPSVHACKDGSPTSAAYEKADRARIEWSGVDSGDVTGRLVDVGITSGLAPTLTERIVRRALTNGISKPIRPKAS